MKLKFALSNTKIVTSHLPSICNSSGMMKSRAALVVFGVTLGAVQQEKLTGGHCLTANGLVQSTSSLLQAILPVDRGVSGQCECHYLELTGGRSFVEQQIVVYVDKVATF